MVQMDMLNYKQYLIFMMETGNLYVTYNHDYNNSSLNNCNIYIDGQLIINTTNTIGIYTIVILLLILEV